jgi:hypothetical protein
VFFALPVDWWNTLGKGAGSKLTYSSSLSSGAICPNRI